jgi:hypothetical protein
MKKREKQREWDQRKKQTAGMEAADRCSKTTTAKESSTRCREKQKTPTKKKKKKTDLKKTLQMRL